MTNPAPAKESLRASDILEGMLDGFVAVDGEFRIRYANAAAGETAGAPPAGLLGKLYWEALPAVFGQFREEALEKALRQRTAFHLESVDPATERRFGIEVYPGRGGGAALHFRQLGKGEARPAADLPSLKAATEALRESQERLRLIIENAREFAIFSLDLEGRVVSWNVGAQRLLGYAEEEILGQSAERIFLPEERDGLGKEMAVALREGRSNDERWHLRKDGSRLWSNGYLMAMRDAEGKTVGFVKILHDRTAAKEAEEALKQSRQELIHALEETERAREKAEAASRTKDQFLATLSHELRTPLVPVQMAAESLLRHPELPPLVKDAMETIRRNIDLETHFINDLLDLTRISHDKLELAREPVDLHQVLQAGVDVSRPDLASKGQRLAIVLGAAEHRVVGDTRRLQQVFWNLLKNASKFTPEKGEITVQTRNEADQIIVEISDTGMGFGPALGTQIFEAFRQGDETITRQLGGLGLGLAIAKAVVDAHGGQISAFSNGPGTGATFRVKLPRPPQEAP